MEAVARQPRCLIGDRSLVFVRGLARVLEGSGMSVVGQATSPRCVLELVARCDCDLVVACFEPIDEAIAIVMGIEQPTLILSSTPTPDDLARAVGAGAHGLVPKDASEAELVAAAHDVAAGRLVIGSAWVPSLVQHLGMLTGTEAGGALTAREREIVQRLVEGRSNKQVGHSLGIAEQTVKNHLRSIMSKLGVSSRIDLCRWAVEHGVAPISARHDEPAAS